MIDKDITEKNEPLSNDDLVLNPGSHEESATVKFNTHQAQELIDLGRIKELFESIDLFEGLSCSIAEQMIAAGHGFFVARSIKNFAGLNNSIAEQLIAAGYGSHVGFHLEKFEGLDYQKIAEQMIAAGEGHLVANHLEKFEGLDHLLIAEQLIVDGHGNGVANHLEKFEGLNASIAEQLIVAGYGDYVVNKLEKFEDLNYRIIAEQMIAAGEGHLVANHLEKFEGLNASTAEQLIVAGYGHLVANHLEKFEGLNASTAEQLIVAGYGDYVVNKLEKFEGLDYQKIAEQMIAAGEGRLVANHLEKFEDLNASMADQLIADGYGADVACYLDKFEGLDHQKIAEQMIAVGEVKSIVHYFSKFEGLNVYIAEQMIAAGHGDSVGQNLKKFESLNVFIAEQLIAAGHGVYITSYIDKFEGLDHKKFAEQMIATGHINSVAQNLEKFEGLDHQIANKLIKAGYGRAVGECLDIFEGNDFQTLANSLIQTGCGDVVANNLDRFASLSYSYLAIRLIQAGQGAAVAQNIDKFSGLNLQEIMIMIIDDHRGYAIAQNLEKFEGLNQQEIVERLIGKGQGSAITENLEKFEGINQQDLINRLIEENQYYAITNNLNKFNNLSFEFASKLVEEGYILEVILGLKGFDEPEKILISFNSKYCQSADIADAVIENLSAVNLNSNDLKNLLFACAENYSTAQKIKGLDLAGLGLEPEYILELLEQISQMKPELKDIKRSNPYEYTAGSIEYVTITKPGTELHTQAVKINKSLREALKNKESMLCGMAQLTEMLLDQLAEKIAIHEGNEKEAVKKEMGAVYRRLAADYLALELYQMDNQNDISGKIFSDFEHLDLDRQNLLNAGLGEALIKANKHYLNVLDVDTPFYDKIYSEWDTKRIGEKDFQEIFLGRDGIYAFIGRRAQIYARRRMLRPDDIQKHESTMPTYIVYPRYFRDYLSSEAKSVYLRQSIEAPKAAHYYDTGFEGTIPQDIMSILGLPEDQWDARIRLLSANRRQRTVLGLIGDKQERNTLVGNVEHNVKDENSATGLFENSDGRIEPISQPNSPSERLSFALIQQALHRHYYMQELDRQKAVDARFKSVSLGDSELRLSQTLTQTQQQQLIDFFDTPDVGQKLVQDSRIIKMADPQGPFPDEAVFEIDLAETSGSIVKSVVSTKQHGPLDEFEALLLLERLGIDAPKPLGRLFTNEQHGFIVIDKLPGVSGRTIKSYFISENIDTSDQQRLLKDTERMMTTIAETVRRDAGLDKPWRLKDFMIVFGKNDDGKIIIERMLPIDFERATVFDSSKPHSIKLGQDLD